MNLRRQSVAGGIILDEHEANELFILLDDLVDQDLLICFSALPRKPTSDPGLELDDHEKAQLLLNSEGFGFVTDVEVVFVLRVTAR